MDLTREYLQIALCAQHSNGGIAVDLWWQTSVRGLFAAGECAGTHGVTRPGGSALNAGQVGSLRAAQFISKKANPTLPEAEFEQLAEQTAAQYAAEIDRVLQNPDTIRTDLHAAQRRMSDRAAAIRSREQMEQALHDCRTQLQQLSEKTGVGTRKTVSQYYKLRDILVTQMAVLTAMIDFAETAGCTRGSAHYYDKTGVLRDGLRSSSASARRWAIPAAACRRFFTGTVCSPRRGARCVRFRRTMISSRTSGRRIGKIRISIDEGKRYGT